MSMLPGHTRAAFAQARNDRDWYVEPESCVRQLFQACNFQGLIHDPCCGQGTIPKVAADFGYTATGSDIINRQPNCFWLGPIDFLGDTQERDNIVSNPPFNLAEHMWVRACTVARYKVAFVLRITFLNGQGRANRLFSDTRYRPTEVLVLSQRPSMPPGGKNIPAKGGTTDYAWFTRNRVDAGLDTRLRWI